MWAPRLAIHGDPLRARVVFGRLSAAVRPPTTYEEVRPKTLEKQEVTGNRTRDDNCKYGKSRPKKI